MCTWTEELYNLAEFIEIYRVQFSGLHPCIQNNIKLASRIHSDKVQVINSCLMLIKQRFWLWVPPLALNNWTVMPSKFWTLRSRFRNLSNILVLEWIRLYQCLITSVMYVAPHFYFWDVLAPFALTWLKKRLLVLLILLLPRVLIFVI